MSQPNTAAFQTVYYPANPTGNILAAGHTYQKIDVTADALPQIVRGGMDICTEAMNRFPNPSTNPQRNLFLRQINSLTENCIWQKVAAQDTTASDMQQPHRGRLKLPKTST